MANKRDYYEVLGVSKNASDAEIDASAQVEYRRNWVDFVLRFLRP